MNTAAPLYNLPPTPCLLLRDITICETDLPRWGGWWGSSRGYFLHCWVSLLPLVSLETQQTDTFCRSALKITAALKLWPCRKLQFMGLFSWCRNCQRQFFVVVVLWSIYYQRFWKKKWSMKMWIMRQQKQILQSRLELSCSSLISPAEVASSQIKVYQKNKMTHFRGEVDPELSSKCH